MLPEEQEFLDRIYHEHFVFLHRLCLQLLLAKGIPDYRCSDLAEELVQDVFKVAAKRMDVLMEHPNPVGWLVVAAKKKSLEYSRRAEADRKRLLLMDALAALDAAPGPALETDPSAHLEYGASIELIRKTLSEDDFRLFDMVVLRHMTHLAASQELGINISTSQKRLQRIREKLQKLFSP